MEKYENETCLEALRNGDRNCTEKCVPNCAKWIYEIDVRSDEDMELLDYNNSQYVNIKIMNLDYLIMIETYVWTFELFIGALGGAMGMWLGLDFIALIEFIFKPITILYRNLLPKQSESIVWFSNLLQGYKICVLLSLILEQFQFDC